MNLIERAHAACTCHRAEVLASRECGCFYCLATFPPSQVKLWTDGSRRGGQTALCPRCGVDAVIGDASGLFAGPDLPQRDARAVV